MNKFFDGFKKIDPKAKKQIFVIFIIGIALLIFGKGMGGMDNDSSKEDSSKMNIISHSGNENIISSYEKDLERRLEEALSKVEGVGQVKVVITLIHKNEIDIAQDVISETSELKEGESGSQRVTTTESVQRKNVIINDRDGNNQPLVTKQIEPKIEGVIIIAQGGGNAIVKDLLSKSAQALTGVPAHKVQVLKMKAVSK